MMTRNEENSCLIRVSPSHGGTQGAGKSLTVSFLQSYFPKATNITELARWWRYNNPLYSLSNKFGITMIITFFCCLLHMSDSPVWNCLSLKEAAVCSSSSKVNQPVCHPSSLFFSSFVMLVDDRYRVNAGLALLLRWTPLPSHRTRG